MVSGAAKAGQGLVVRSAQMRLPLEAASQPAPGGDRGLAIGPRGVTPHPHFGLGCQGCRLPVVRVHGGREGTACTINVAVHGARLEGRWPAMDLGNLPSLRPFSVSPRPL